MAVLTAISSLSRDYATFVWSGLGAGDVGLGIEIFRYPDRTVQSYLTGSGEIGSSSVLIEGCINSNTGSDGVWNSLHDAQGNDINLNVASGHIELIFENTSWLRPRITTGAGSLISIGLFAIRY